MTDSQPSDDRVDKRDRAQQYPVADTRIRSSHSSQAPPSTARRRQFLALGASAVAGSLAGCLSLRGPAADPATDPVCRWNEQFIEEIQHFRGGNFAPTRRGALLNVAMFDAVNGVVAAADEDHFEPYFADPTDAPADAPPLAALAGAADEVMTTLYGSEFDETLEATLVAADGGDAGAGEAWVGALQRTCSHTATTSTRRHLRSLRGGDPGRLLPT